jgi:hypothetical protein
MHPPLAHHLGEDSLVNLLLVGGAGLSLMVVEGRVKLAAIHARLTRRSRGRAREPDREGYVDRGRGEAVPRSGRRQPDDAALLPTGTIVRSRFWKA